MVRFCVFRTRFVQHQPRRFKVRKHWRLMLGSRWRDTHRNGFPCGLREAASRALVGDLRQPSFRLRWSAEVRDRQVRKLRHVPRIGGALLLVRLQRMADT